MGSLTSLMGAFAAATALLLAWLWPAVLALFAVQVGLALGQNLVPTVVGVPLLLYDLTQFLIASTRVAAEHGLAVPTFLLAPGAAQAALLSLLLGISSIGSPLAMAVPPPAQRTGDHP